VSFKESNEPTGGYPGDEDPYRAVIHATLSECRDRIQAAIDALEANDATAYASAVADFTTVRTAAKEWIDLLDG